MAGTRSRYRNAYEAGANGRELPEGLGALADQDPLIDQAHDAGRHGVDFDDWHQANVRGVPTAKEPQGEPTSGPSSRRPARRGLRRPSRPSLRRPLGGTTVGASPVHSVAGVALGGVAYALILSVADYGISGPEKWFKAKFLNEPAAKASTKAAA